MLLQHSPFDIRECPMSNLFHMKSFDLADDVIPTRLDSLVYSGHGPQSAHAKFLEQLNSYFPK